jgi:SprT protein
MLRPHTQEQIKCLAVAAVRAAERRACEFYSIRLPEAQIDFSLRGRCAGQARVGCGGTTLLRINLTLLTENLADFLAQTIPHEVAHLIVNWQARSRRKRPRPHGPEWRRVMQCCYGLQPIRCHSYATTPARFVPRNFLYRCACREHRLTGITHRRITHHGKALCKSCGAYLTFITELAPLPPFLRATI